MGKAASIILVDYVQILRSICYLLPPHQLVWSRGGNSTINYIKQHHKDNEE